MTLHHTHANGKLHTLDWTDAKGVKRTTGVAAAAEFDFGRATRKEIVTVLSGSITKNNTTYNPSQQFTVNPGDQLKFSTTEGTHYSSYYPDPKSEQTT